MLDNILVNVFGRSKKQSNSVSSLSSANSQLNQENENNDGFIVLGQTNAEKQSINLTTNEEPPPLYPSATILTNDVRIYLFLFFNSVLIHFLIIKVFCLILSLNKLKDYFQRHQ
jgi:hypothetical protein